MNNPQSFPAQFFGVAIRGQTYLNLGYLFLAFPLGLVYFLMIVLGLSLGLGLLVLWIGAIILAGLFFGWWACALLERQLAVSMLHEDIPPMKRSDPAGMKTWDRIKSHFADPVTWKSLVYLLAKFPLGIISFVLLVTLLTITLAFLSAPALYRFLPMQMLYFGGTPYVVIDTLWEALVCFFVGTVLLFPTLHLLNGLAWVSGRFAKLMLS